MIPHYNSSLAEYKLSRLKKKIKYTEVNFPKSLSLDFAKSLILTRAQTSSGAVRRKMEEEGVEENEIEAKIESFESMDDLRSRASDDASDHSSLHSRIDINNFDMISSYQSSEPLKETVVDFFRVCALCELRLPRESVEMQVIRKHVVKLRYIISIDDYYHYYSNYY